jgi:hypothetical protein
MPKNLRGPEITILTVSPQTQTKFLQIQVLWLVPKKPFSIHLQPLENRNVAGQRSGM